jgi:N utilization substance protein A
MTSTYEVAHSVQSSERTQANLNAERIELGIEHGLKEIPGVTRLMLSVFAEHAIQSIEDLAGCATNDLTGWWECRQAKTIRHRGILDGFGVSRQDCEAMILNARIRVGWISSYP